MAATAPSAESDTHSGRNQSSPYHLPLHFPNEPKIGAHVIYMDGAIVRDALVQVVFTEHGAPPLTLVMVKTGSRGDLQTKRLVPHKSKCAQGEACWCRPEEVVR